LKSEKSDYETPRNPWNKFEKKHAGEGLTKERILELYDLEHNVEKNSSTDNIITDITTQMGKDRVLKLKIL